MSDVSGTPEHPKLPGRLAFPPIPEAPNGSGRRSGRSAISDSGTPAEPGGSRLLAAFDALTGPVPSAPADAATADEGEKHTIRAQFEANGGGLPSRKPRRSWSELQSSAVVDSPADKLFGDPVDGPRTRSSLGAAFADFEPGATTGPADGATVLASRWAGPVGPAATAETAEPAEAAEPVADATTTGATTGLPSGAAGEPSGASAGAVAASESPTYDEPIGPERRPAGLPRRGERSATTIASLLTEALAAYQATTDEAEDHRAPERFDSFPGTSTDANTIAGRHRSE